MRPQRMRHLRRPARARLPGGPARPSADAFSPTNHAPGEHGDLYRAALRHRPAARRCPRAPSCTTLYREMRDDHYLDEEAGRRAHRRRRLARHDRPRRAAAPGGCSTWAAATACCSTRRAARGYDVPGSSCPRPRCATRATSSASTCATRWRGLDSGADGGFDVIVLADVIEHLDDPLGGARPLPRGCSPRRRALRGHAGPGVAHGAARRRALVGLRPRPHLPAARARRCASCSSDAG